MSNLLVPASFGVPCQGGKQLWGAPRDPNYETFSSHLDIAKIIISTGKKKVSKKTIETFFRK